MFGYGSLRNISKLRAFKRRRESSYDKTGGNLDFVMIKHGEKKVLMDMDGPGCITHIWTTQLCLLSPHFQRNLILRIWWDNEPEPSVECPLTDFFGCGHGEYHNFVSVPLQMSPSEGKGFNSWWPMPYRKHVKIELENDNVAGGMVDLMKPWKMEKGLMVYYYVDYETYEKFPEDPQAPTGYLHAQFRRVDYKKDMIKDPDTGKISTFLAWQSMGRNTRANGGYDRNHIIMEAKGKGQYVGCHLNIDNRPRLNFNWPGEGDDMIWIDEDAEKQGEPTIFGTGTEDYVNTAFCPGRGQEYSAPYHGIIKTGGFNWRRKITYYRYHIQDPISFERQIKVTIEHGHNNVRGDLWETTAYWYQLEPHEKFPTLPDRKARMPKSEHKFFILKWFFRILGIMALVWLVMWIDQHILGWLGF